jgi:hypothetical protein
MSDLQEYLLALYQDNDNSLTPAMVVDAARPEDSPIHLCFEWDDEAAAEKHRQDQARVLIRRVRIKFIDSTGDVTKVPGFVSVARPTGQSYVPIEEVRTDPFTQKLVLMQAEREWRQLWGRYKNLEEFLSIVRKDLAV